MTKTLRKTESLSYPTNPLAAIRELQELNSAERDRGAATSNDNASGRPVALSQSDAVGSATGSAPSNADRSDRSSKVARATSSATVGEGSGNPMKEAILQ